MARAFSSGVDLPAVRVATLARMSSSGSVREPSRERYQAPTSCQVWKLVQAMCGRGGSSLVPRVGLLSSLRRAFFFLPAVGASWEDCQR